MQRRILLEDHQISHKMEKPVTLFYVMGAGIFLSLVAIMGLLQIISYNNTF